MMEQFRDCSSSLKAPVSPLEENCITPSVSPLLSAAMRMGEELWAQAYAPRDLSAEMLVRAPELPELRPPSPRCETGGEPSAIGGHGASSVPRPGSAGCFTLCLPLQDQAHSMGRNGGGQAQQVLHRMVAAGGNNSAVCGWSHRWGSRSTVQPRAGPLFPAPALGEEGHWTCLGLDSSATALAVLCHAW
ncbi:uncharacterized protein LOC135280730 isoform X2 [Passer domesticus]|uniref:uncharacterized protein LOC135280730 isoform X2 n=1 Tax=Passer domesticus TaxID=48849 RepID=UPI0030FF3481